MYMPNKNIYSCFLKFFSGKTQLPNETKMSLKNVSEETLRDLMAEV